MGSVRLAWLTPHESRSRPGHCRRVDAIVACMDPAVAGFIARHHVSRKQEVEDDAAPSRLLTPSQRLADALILCEAAALLLRSNPDRDRLLMQQEPPHPSYRGIVERLRGR